MMEYTYTYLFATIPLIIVWCVLFASRKDLRKDMLMMSVIFGAAALFVQPMYIQDWWHPPTMLGFAVGIEDLLFGASIGGVAASIYEALYRRREERNIRRTRNDQYVLFAALMTCGTLFFATIAFGFSSFAASIVSLSLPTAYLWWQRSDLIVHSLVSGLLTASLMIPCFLLAELYSPGWVTMHWKGYVWGGFMSAPIGDLVWAFLLGCLVGPLYEYAFGFRTRTAPTRH